jgi:hypothetical protein
MLGVFAEFETNLQERQMEGIAKGHGLLASPRAAPRQWIASGLLRSRLMAGEHLRSTQARKPSQHSAFHTD